MNSGKAVTLLDRCRATLPYLVVLAIGAFLYYAAENFEFEQSSGRIGPGAWPKLILILMLASALWGAVSSALQVGKADELDADADQMEALVRPPEIYPWLVWLAVAATLGYLLILPVLGFFLGTIIYAFVLMYLGHYRAVRARYGFERGDRVRLHVHVHARGLCGASGRDRAIRPPVVCAHGRDGRALGGGVVIVNLAHGFVQVFQPFDLLMLFVGLLVGMAVSIMPGLGLVMGVILALPFTYRMPIEPAVILLTAIYFSGTYGGCFTAILYRIPGEPMDVPMLWDGYTMAQRGQPAKALGWALLAALIAGLVSSTVMVALAGPMSEAALKFDSPDYFAAVFFGLTTVVALAGKSLVNSLISLCVGLLVATIGIDSIYGTDRFTFGVPILRDGVQLVEVLVGMYGLGEVLARIGQGLHLDKPKEAKVNVATQFPSLREFWAIKMTLLRSTVLGTVLGIVPGAGATITSFIAYGIEKQYGRRRHLLGTGIPEGIVAPQIGATASVAGHMIPLLTLGLPGSGATAVILAAFLLHGVQPGPMLFEDPGSSLMVYTILASMFASVIGMCLVGFFWIRVVVKVLTIPQGILSAIVVMFCLVGAYANRNDMSDVWMIVDLRRAWLSVRKIQIPDLADGAWSDFGTGRRDRVHAQHDLQRQRLDRVLPGTDLRPADGRFASRAELPAAARTLQYASPRRGHRHFG